MKINCPNCSANMKYSPHEGKCFCEQCAQYIEIKSIPIESYKINYNETVCSGCGARIIVDETNVVTVYMGSILIFIVLAAIFLLMGYYADNIYGAGYFAPISVCALICGFV